MTFLHHWRDMRCWVCLGRGVVRSLEGRMECPNPHCPHAKRGKS